MMTNEIQPKNAVIYLRVSSEEQVENFSLGTQEEICRREATRLPAASRDLYSRDAMRCARKGK